MKISPVWAFIIFVILLGLLGALLPEPAPISQPSIQKNEFARPAAPQQAPQMRQSGGGIVMPTPTVYTVPPGGFDAANAGKTCVPTGLYWHAGGCVASTSCGQYESRPREVCQAAGLVW